MERKRTDPKSAWIAACLLALLLAGCAALKPKPAGISNEQAGQVAENILRAIEVGDYTGFIQDFSEEMKKAFPKTEFDTLGDLLSNASGQYQSIGEPTLSNKGDYANYNFPAQYTQENVTVTLTFKIGGDKVEGLWFDSQNLRKALQ